MEKVRLNLQVSADLNAELEQIAAEHGITKGDVVRSAFALLKASHAATKNGYHVGASKDTNALDKEFIGVL